MIRLILDIIDGWEETKSSQHPGSELKGRVSAVGISRGAKRNGTVRYASALVQRDEAIRILCKNYPLKFGNPIDFNLECSPYCVCQTAFTV